jgi:hypothetical protein
MFTEERDACRFSWSDLGDPALGRPNLGSFTTVLAYRLLQYTMRDVLIAKYDVQTANVLFAAAGKLAGEQFCRHLLNTNLPFDAFIAELQRVLKEETIGILRVEQADLEKMEFTLTVAEDLDCSGLPMSGEVVCTYDEGFIAGILHAYTRREFEVKEIDCWASGDRTCRFDVRLRTGDSQPACV